jgi:hypothetical protein
MGGKSERQSRKAADEQGQSEVAEECQPWEKSLAKRAEPRSAVVGGTQHLTDSGFDQWRSAGSGWGQEAQRDLVNGTLCAQGMNGSLCEGRRGVGGWEAAGCRNAWVLREPAGMRDRRQNSLLSNTDCISGTIPGSHPRGGAGC